MKEYYDEHRSQAATGVTYTVFAVRVIRGWTMVDALTKPATARQRNEDLISFWKANRDRAGEGISYELLRSRLSYGWDIETALTQPARNRS